MTVLVVGAGPTGLATAVGLTRAGATVRVVDAAAEPATTSRALGLQPRGVEVLDRLDALGDLPQRSVQMRGTVIRVDGRERLRLTLPSEPAPDGPATLVISQAEIEAQLRRRLTDLGGGIEWGTGVTGLSQDSAGVAVAIEGGERFRCDWVTGCDGASSVVRKAVGIGLVGETVAERFLLADVQVALPGPRDLASMWAADDETLAAIPLPGDDAWRLMAPNPPAQPDHPNAAAILDVLAGLLRRHAGDPARIQDVLWTSAFSIHRRLADRYRRGRVLLAGDAAHIHSPVGGQGMNTGLGDAENLAWKLALVDAGRADPGLLDSYEAERRPVASAVVTAVGGIDKLLLSKNPAVAGVRDHVLFPLVRLPRVQRRIWRKASQLDITYRAGPLAQGPNRKIAGLRSGDRVPDLHVRTANGPTRLHAVLRDRWALVSGPGDVGSDTATVLRELLGEDRLTELSAPDLPPHSVLLVRPDGHLGWHGDTPDPAATHDWLVAVLTGRSTRADALDS